MKESNQLNFAWLSELTNPHHDGMTQQIDDFAAAFTTDNARYLAMAEALHQARQKEDEVWLKSQRDPAAKSLEKIDKRQDGYISAVRGIITGHSYLPEDEPTKAEAEECVQVFKDYNFRTTDAYGAESDKIIQMQQNFEPHQTFLTQIGAWPFLVKAVTEAQQVRQLIGERAMTMGQFVKGEMKEARRATDEAVASLYKVINAMMELMPSDALTNLVTQLKGLELYARQYYLSGKPNYNENGGSTPNPDPNTGGDTPDPNTGGDTPDPNSGGDTPDPNTGGGDTPGGNGGGDTPGGNGGGDNPGGNSGGGGDNNGGLSDDDD